MKEFTNPRELIGQMGADLQAKAGKVGNRFRRNIREELEGLSNKNATISITQAANGSMVSLKIGDWVDETEKIRIKQQFESLMRRIGANTAGTCCGVVPGGLTAFLH